MRQKRNMSEEDLSEQEDTQCTSRKVKPRKIIVSSQKGATGLPTGHQKENTTTENNTKENQKPKKITVSTQKGATALSIKKKAIEFEKLATPTI